MIERQAFLDAFLRQEFAFFLRKVFATISPGDDLHWNWHLDAFAWQLDQVRAGNHGRVFGRAPANSSRTQTADPGGAQA